MNKNEIIAETERLILRRYREDDLADLYEYLSDAEVVRFEPYRPMNMSEAEAELCLRIAADEMIAVELKTSRRLIGNVYLGRRDCKALEIGFVFNRQFWGHGYAKESCAELIRLAFAGGTHRIYAECDPQNVNSWRLLESLKFEREAHLRQNVYFWLDENGNPVWKDTFIYALLNN